MVLASRFYRNSPSLRSETPLGEDQLRAVAPSIFAEAPHASRSERYTYIPTIDVLRGLRNEGFEPFFVCQTKVRSEDRREFTKHMLRLRHAGQVNDGEAGEIILLNSHDGTSSYQMLAGMFRFVCSNGLVCGEVLEDVRVPHKGQIVDSVVEGAFDILEGFDLVREVRDDLRGVALSEDQAQAFARAALALKYEPAGDAGAPITENQLLAPRRVEDGRPDLWSTFNRVQENLVAGGLQARLRNGRRASTRGVTGIDQGIKLNRALWILAEEMKRLAK